MMDKQEILDQLQASGVVAVLRTDQPERLVEVAQALVAGGVTFIEITLTVPRALEAIRQAIRATGETAVIGAGTVLDARTAEEAILAGARYIVTPVLRPAVIEICRRQGVACFAGALTPTEILTAWELGADLVKVFPAGTLGPSFIRDLKGPFPDVELMPTGGITLATAPEFIRAGAHAVGMGGELVSKKMIAENQLDRIRQNAARLTEAIRRARAG